MNKLVSALAAVSFAGLVPSIASAADLDGPYPPRAEGYYEEREAPPPRIVERRYNERYYENDAYYFDDYRYRRPYPYYAAYPYWGPRHAYWHRPYWRAHYWGPRRRW